MQQPTVNKQWSDVVNTANQQKDNFLQNSIQESTVNDEGDFIPVRPDRNISRSSASKSIWSVNTPSRSCRSVYSKNKENHANDVLLSTLKQLIPENFRTKETKQVDITDEMAYKISDHGHFQEIFAFSATNLIPIITGVINYVFAFVRNHWMHLSVFPFPGQRGLEYDLMHVMLVIMHWTKRKFGNGRKLTTWVLTQQNNGELLQTCTTLLSYFQYYQKSTHYSNRGDVTRKNLPWNFQWQAIAKFYLHAESVKIAPISNDAFVQYSQDASMLYWDLQVVYGNEQNVYTANDKRKVIVNREEQLKNNLGYPKLANYYREI